MIKKATLITPFPSAKSLANVFVQAQYEPLVHSGVQTAFGSRCCSLEGASVVFRKALRCVMVNVGTASGLVTCDSDWRSLVNTR